MKSYNLLRPGKLYKEILKVREKDGIAFYKKHSKKFIITKCPTCSGKGRFVFKKYGFSHNICNYCKTLYCSPRPDEQMLSLYYKNYDAPKMWTELLLKADVHRKQLQYMPRVKNIISIIKKCGVKKKITALDVGAGSGAFALCLQKSRYFKEIVALDISELCVSACKKNGLRARLGTIADYQKDSMDLICVNDLIEHLFNPLSFLKKCHALLRKNGLIAIATPNGEGFDFKIMKDAVKNVTPPEHLNYFNPFSIEKILNYSKFKIVSIETPGRLDVEMVDRARKEGLNLKRNNEYINYLLEQNDTIKDNLQKFISQNKLSSHMLVVAQKE